MTNVSLPSVSDLVFMELLTWLGQVEEMTLQHASEFWCPALGWCDWPGHAKYPSYYIADRRLRQ